MHQLKLSTPSPFEIVLTRQFDSPRVRVFEAYTQPESLKQWLLGPPGWTLDVCEVALNPGDAYRFVWSNVNGTVMGMGGVCREFVRPERIVQTERFDRPWYPGEALVTVMLTESGGVTTLTLTVRYESQEARDAVLQTPMEQGLAAGYDRLDGLLASHG